MAKQSVSRTALGAAICRLIEQYQPEKIRLFYDPVANELVGGYIPIDFDAQTLETVFSGTGFNPLMPTIFIWDGDTVYLVERS